MHAEGQRHTINAITGHHEYTIHTVQGTQSPQVGDFLHAHLISSNRFYIIAGIFGVFLIIYTTQRNNFAKLGDTYTVF